MTKEQLGTLILDSERQMYSTAKSMLYSDQDCADAIQETIVKAFSGVHTLRNDKYAKTWLMRILINECYTILRKTSKVISLDEMCETTELAADEKSDYSDLYKAVGSLKEDLRMPVILYLTSERLRRLWISAKEPYRRDWPEQEENYDRICRKVRRGHEIRRDEKQYPGNSRFYS